ncbi:MAG TPA: histidine kinase [Acidimicrobiales bacterium]|nr:histidine kinase [Acidimicrobiales bacterium]
MEERNRIAREIHDVLAHSLGALSVQIQAARAVLTDQGDVARALELLGQAQRMTTDGLKETRRALLALRGGTPRLRQGLADLGAAHQNRHRAAVSFQVSGEPRSLSADAWLALTRAAQEALVNTAKYAPHQLVEVRLEYREGRTALTIANRLPDPAGGESPGLETANGGYGLAGMRERLRLIDGSLSAGPHDGKWVVDAEVPQ